MNVDGADVDDPAAVSEYVNDIYNFFRSVEVRARPRLRLTAALPQRRAPHSLAPM